MGLAEPDPDILWIGDGNALLDLLLDWWLPIFSFSASSPMGYDYADVTVLLRCGLSLLTAWEALQILVNG